MGVCPQTQPIPGVTAEEMAAVDRAETEEYRLHLLQMMENAGRHSATLTRQYLNGGGSEDQSIMVVCGRGQQGRWRGRGTTTPPVGADRPGCDGHRPG